MYLAEKADIEKKGVELSVTHLCRHTAFICVVSEETQEGKKEKLIVPTIESVDYTNEKIKYQNVVKIGRASCRERV